MVTRKPPAAKAESAQQTVTTVNVKPGYLVFHDGQQRGGTLTGVPVEVAEVWRRHHWVT
jgi:hypothetical protein